MQSVQTSGGESIRVLVADDTRIHTQLLADALRRDGQLEVISPPARSRDLVEAVKQHGVSIVVLSSNLDEEPLRGFELLRELRANNPGILAIMLLDSSKRESVLQAFRAGARGIFSRHDSLETLSRCIRSVYEGQIWANGQQMAYAVEALASSPEVRAVDANGLSLLSKREMDVVRSLAEGLTNREIAARLGLSQHTIKNYLFRLYDKLGVSNRLELLFMTLTQPGASQAIAQAAADASPNEPNEQPFQPSIAAARETRARPNRSPAEPEFGFPPASTVRQKQLDGRDPAARNLDGRNPDGRNLDRRERAGQTTRSTPAFTGSDPLD